ncbi:zinc finger domain-containing protein [Mycobacteroides chelonae]|uniref:zinc finger domain-containing protein n=3 Tax=Mycobacteroides chelonae TaxID=1774 RepID=UPI0008A8E01A|nr:hypothetical protein [Mycobacteroides chelonae]OHT57303.1 hypothetical protein BKG63_01965 [Mycobacteroides chelonae]OHT96801.1 hypothetical protein BKG72_11745 [Mycobacteroides chelonae]OLT93873.1 hypothetical protein BKG59_04075 [Mycobacteroides chelonae]
MNRNDVIDVLTAVAAADRRTVGETDVDVWQAVIGDLPRSLALTAVRDHLRENPGVWLEPGHVYGRVKVMRRDQLDRESREEREARQAQLEAKSVEPIARLAQHLDLDVGLKYHRRGADQRPELSIRCPYPPCGASAGKPCWNSATGSERKDFHPSRSEAARAVA